MDVNLAWNESDYGNVQDVRIPPSSLWKPDILMYNRWSVKTSNINYPPPSPPTSPARLKYLMEFQK